MSKFSLTTPIYYVNGKPHIGHAYTTIVGDVLARYHRLLGDDVYYLTGTDENAQKNVESALSHSGGVVGDVRAEVQAYVDEMSAIWRAAWDMLEISYDDFIRTTEKRHVDVVKDFWSRAYKNNDIYKGTYKGLYCTGCEGYKTEADLVDGVCPDHKKPPVELEEENYFFRFSKYKDTLIKFIESHERFIQPVSRRNEVLAFIRDHGEDFSISRKNLEWGIPVPGDESQTIYVWFDALINYLSASPERWPSNLHLVGKDIIKFHCAYWPAMLLSAGYDFPESVFAHGFFTIDGEKMSKTIGNVIDPVLVVTTFGNDPLRFTLLREIPFGSDGDFSLAKLHERYKKELANDLGNLVSRVVTMTHKFAKGAVPQKAKNLSGAEFERVRMAYHSALSAYLPDRALEEVWGTVRWLNQYVEEKKPWVLAKEGKSVELAESLYTLLEGLRLVGVWLLPFLPKTALAILERLGQEAPSGFRGVETWGTLVEGTRVFEGPPLFPQLLGDV